MSNDEIGKLVYDESFLNYCFRRDAEDIAHWENWLKAHPESAEQIAELKNIVTLLAQETADRELQQQMEVLSERMHQRPVRRMFPYRWVAAASILVAVSAGLFFYSHRQKPQQVVLLKASDIKGGGTNAILTLANGNKINISTAAVGVIASQGGLTITKATNGTITYSQNAEPDASGFNTVETPIGYTSEVNLPDGSKVWLNAASKLKYPVAFNNNERLVELTGEAYFEVVHTSRDPFRVKTAGQLVEDVGTHFDINAYADEPNSRTTVLEGSVNVSANDASKILMPGQQAILSPTSLTVKKANTDQVIAWKNGTFDFDNTDLYALMRQISRWYNVKVIYEGQIKNEPFFGEVDKSYNLEEVFKVLELSGLHFRVESSPDNSSQKRLIVTP